MAAFPGEFDDAPDEERVGPLLPPEDRLWRHPSELGQNGNAPLDPIHVRENWLGREPTRANAWTAGLVGALLATGIVVVGTHLASALGHGVPAAVIQPGGESSTVTTLVETSPDLGSSIKAAISRTGNAVSVINIANPAGQKSVLGLTLGSDGMLLTAAAPFLTDSNVADSSILVTLPNESAPFVGDVVGIDRRSGLALIHVNGAANLPGVRFSAAAPSTSEAYFAVIAPSPIVRYAATLVTRANVTPSIAGTTLVDAGATDLDGNDTPLGSPLVAPSGQVVGIVVGNVGGHAVFAPTWLALPVATELQRFGSVRQGWLGIEGASETAKTATTPGGVMIKNIVPRGAADRAGLRPGDLIVSLNGSPISTMPALQGHLYILKPDTTVSLEIVRRGVHHSMPILLGNALGY